MPEAESIEFDSTVNLQSLSGPLRDIQNKIDAKKSTRSNETLGADVTTDGSTFLKCRIQRAMADLHTQFERGQAEEAELRCEALEGEIAALKEAATSEAASRAKDERALQVALEESRERVRLLTLLHLEAGRLLKTLVR